jgi:hypothetical protein
MGKKLMPGFFQEIKKKNNQVSFAASTIWPL